MKKNKILFSVLHVLPTIDPEYGGPVVVAEALVNELKKQKVDAKIFPPLNSEKKIITLLKLPSLIKRSNLVHIHCLWNIPSLISAAFARFYKIPYIITPHGMLDKWSLKKNKFIKSLYGFLFEYRNLSAAARVHFLNKEELNEASNLGINFNSFILANGVDVEEYSSLPNKINFLRNHKILKNKTIGLFLGRLDPKKGFNILIPAFAIAVKQVPDLHLLIAGPDKRNYKIEIQEMINKFNLNNYVTFLGMIKNEKKKEVLHISDFFVLPSYQEGDSIAVKEAMASSLPVIITPACHFPEVSNLNAGLITQPEVNELSHSIINLAINNSLCKAMGKNAFSLINRYYTWQSIAHKLKSIYIEILNIKTLND